MIRDLVGTRGGEIRGVWDSVGMRSTGCFGEYEGRERGRGENERERERKERERHTHHLHNNIPPPFL